MVLKMNVKEPHTGRPVEVELSAVEKRSYDLLDRLGIEYVSVAHDEAPTIAALEAVEAVIGCSICKNLFLTNRQQTDFYLLLMPGNKPFKTKYLSSQLGCARLSFASPEQLMELLGVTPGSASLLALEADSDNKVRLVIDSDLLESADFACHPCKNTATLKMKLDAVLEKLIPELGHTPTYVSLPWEQA